MLARFLFNLSGNLPLRLIYRKPGEPYLERYFLGCIFGITIYLHRFVRIHVDEEPHNHPWNGFTICLAGGYTEETLDDFEAWCDTTKDGDEKIYPRWRYRILKPWRWYRIKTGGLLKGTVHRIIEAKPETWTLFFAGKRKRMEGFDDSWFFSGTIGHDVLGDSYAITITPANAQIKQTFGEHAKAIDGGFAEQRWWKHARTGAQQPRQPFQL